MYQIVDSLSKKSFEEKMNTLNERYAKVEVVQFVVNSAPAYTQYSALVKLTSK
jgi:hypothetical protein